MANDPKYISKLTIPDNTGTDQSYDIKDAGAARASHTHGNIQNGGVLQTTDITIANGDKLVVTDASDGHKIARSSTAFDGSTTNYYLSKKGTFEPISSIGNFVKYGDVLMPTNPFGGKQLYINSIDNAFASAQLKYWVRITTHKKVVNGVTYPYIDSTKTMTDDDYFVDSPVVSTLTASCFDGSYETGNQCPLEHYMKVHIQFSPFTDTWKPSTGISFTGYPYGTYYLSYYYTNLPAQASQLRVYNKYAAHTVGWHLYTATAYIGTITNANFIEQFADNNDYQRSCLEFIIYSKDTGNKVQLTEIDYRLTRPDLSRDGATVTKYEAQKLYHDFTWNKHNDGAQPTATITLSANTGNITNTGTTQSADVKVTNLTASKLVATDTNKKLVSYTLTTSDIPDLSGTYKTKQTAVSETLSGAAVLATLTQTTNGNVSITTRQLTPSDLGISNPMDFLGVTSTNIKDNPTTNPITIGGSPVTATNGCVAIYGNGEYVWSTNAWYEFGDLSGLDLHELAHKDGVNVNVPSQSVKLKFTGTQQEWTGATIQGTTSGSGQLDVTGTITIGTGSGTANYTPSGVITNGTITIGSGTNVTNLLTSSVAPTATEVLTSVSIPTNSVVINGTSKYIHASSEAISASSSTAVSAYTSNTPSYKSLHTANQTQGSAASWSTSVTLVDNTTSDYCLSFSFTPNTPSTIQTTVATGALDDNTSGLLSSISFGTTNVASSSHTHSAPVITLTSDSVSTNGVSYISSVTQGNPTLTTSKAWTDTFASQPTLSRTTAIATLGTISQGTSTFSGDGVELTTTPVLYIPTHTHDIEPIDVKTTITPSGTITNNGTSETFSTGASGAATVTYSVN